MPYIKQADRAVFDSSIDNMLAVFEHFDEDQHAGILNYIITRLIDGVYLEDKYSKINTAVGILECAKQEFYRRRAAPYEDEKITENGDAYGQVKTLPEPATKQQARRIVRWDYGRCVANVEYYLADGTRIDSFTEESSSMEELRHLVDTTYPLTILYTEV